MGLPRPLPHSKQEQAPHLHRSPSGQKQSSWALHMPLLTDQCYRLNYKGSQQDREAAGTANLILKQAIKHYHFFFVAFEHVNGFPSLPLENPVQ